MIKPFVTLWLLGTWMLAETDGTMIGGLLQYGALGAVLIWFMLRLESVLKEVSHSIAANARRTEQHTLSLVLILQVLSQNPQVTADVRGALQRTISELQRGPGAGSGAGTEGAS